MNAISKPQTHADAAGASLRDAITAANTPLRDGVAAYRAAWSELTTSTNLLDVLRAAGSIVLAAEAIHTAAKAAEATARTALAETMQETGCPAVTLDHHTVHIGTKPSYVAVDDQSAIPPELMRAPPPAPDKVAISKLLRAGVDVPGARLIENHHPICIFRSHSL
jgi:hypothetical protein